MLNRLRSTLGDKYRVERELGRGGMAFVYLAHDLRNQRQVALKVLRPELSAAVGEKRFLREIEIAAALAHPNILSVLDSGEADGFLYSVTTYVDGGSLRDRVRAGAPFALPEARRILSAVADAIAYAHDRGFVHRDIKPENILFIAGEPVVTDFGIARAVLRASAEATLTDTGVTIGTPGYMSPEQAAGERDIDHRADVYSFGVVAYEVLAGARPFVRGSPAQTIAAQIAEPARPILELRRSLPPQVADAVMRCLEKDRTLRPGSARELMAVFESVNGVQLARAARADTWRTLRRRAAAILGRTAT